MKISVLFSQPTRELLILPFTEDPLVPIALQDKTWRPLVSSSLDDKLLYPSRPIIAAEIDLNGYALLALTTGE
ncbi:hypothetical protein [Devosia sp. 2618]|uniref:hypothetical protein n=1 Tax=Devosia sp. 2618 TaxID=3156454 RepID=UPI00339AA294